MSDIAHLESLRAKLTNRRRSMAAKLEDTPEENITGHTFAELQHAIEAVDRAITDEKQTGKR